MVELRKHQQEAVDAIIQSFDKCKTKPRPCLAQLATAAGKSYIIAELARLHQSALILAPTKEIAEQNYQKLLDIGIPRGDIGICSASMGSHQTNRITLGTIGTVKRFADELKEVEVVIVDECVDGECEVLTPDGWMKISEAYECHPNILQYDLSTGKGKFVQPTRWIKNNDYSEKKIKLSLSGVGCKQQPEIIMTKNHRQPVFWKPYNQCERISKVFYANSLPRNAISLITALSVSEEQDVPPLWRLHIMVAADGYCEKRQKWYWHRLSFRRPRKIERAEQILKSCGIEYNKIVNARGDTCFTFRADFCKGLNNIPLEEVSPSQARALCNELILWDGCARHHQFDTSLSKEADFAQAIGFIGGFTTTVTKTIAHNGEHKYFRVRFLNKKTKNLESRNCEKTEISYSNDTYCVSVPSTYFVIRKNHFVFVTGNCDVMPIERAESEYVSFLQQLKSNKICGLTASTWRNQVFKRQFEDPRVYCRPLTRIPMDKGDKTRFGKWFWSGGMVYRCGIRELQALNYLSPINYIVQKTDWSFLDRALGRVDYDEQQLGIWANIDGNREIFERALTWATGQFERTLVFAPNISASYTLCGIAKRLGIKADTIDSKNDNKKNRELKLKRFREGKIQVLFNVAILTAGYDLPSLDCVIMCRATKSLRLYIQSIGRAIRIDPDKPEKVAQVIDMAGNLDRFGRAEDVITTQIDTVSSQGWKYKKDVIAYKPIGAEKYKILDRVS